MPTTDDMRKILDIQDKNIFFEDNCVKHGKRKGKKCKFIYARLTYMPKACEKCGLLNENYTIYRNGNQVSRITLPSTGIYPTYLMLKKQRFKCKECEATFVAKTNLTEEKCFISNQIKSRVVIDSSRAQSVKDISQQNSVSESTTQRLIDLHAQTYKSHGDWLPANLSFDEFSFKKGQFAFVYIDANKGDLLDVLSSRKSQDLRNHFISHYSLKTRKKVQTITVDMNAGYVSLIPELFPDAHIIIDRFHLVQLINRSMNQTRIQVMNQFNTSNGEDQKKYRRLKRYWRKLLKRSASLLHTVYRYYPMFGVRLESTIVDELLTYNVRLKATYDVYQEVLWAISQNDFDLLTQILSKKQTKISKKMKTSLATLKKHLPYIKNTFTYPYSNGCIEGINNKIKVLKRVAYGYHNFLNYKNRILLHFHLRASRIENKKSAFKAA